MSDLVERLRYTHEHGIFDANIAGMLASPDEAAARISELEQQLAARDGDLAEAYRRRDEWRKKAEGFDTIRNALREKVGASWPPSLSRALWAAMAADQKRRADDAEAELDQQIAAMKERHDALALQADEWEGKYAVVSGINASLRKALGDIEHYTHTHGSPKYALDGIKAIREVAATAIASGAYRSNADE